MLFTTYTFQILFLKLYAWQDEQHIKYRKGTLYDWPKANAKITKTLILIRIYYIRQ